MASPAPVRPDSQDFPCLVLQGGSGEPALGDWRFLGPGWMSSPGLMARRPARPPLLASAWPARGFLDLRALTIGKAWAGHTVQIAVAPSALTSEMWLRDGRLGGAHGVCRPAVPVRSARRSSRSDTGPGETMIRSRVHFCAPGRIRTCAHGSAR